MLPMALFARAHNGFNWADRDSWMVSDRSFAAACESAPGPLRRASTLTLASALWGRPDVVAFIADRRE